MEESAESMYNQTHDPSGLVWVAHTGTDAVPNAVYAGKETNDQAVYVARAMYDECVLSGKFVPGLGMYIPYGGVDIKPTTFQVLTNPNDLVQTKWALFEGKIPPTAVKGAFYDVYIWDYIGRTKHNGHTVVRFVSSEDNRLFYNVNGEAHNVEDFEILLAKKRHACQCPLIFQLNSCASCTSYPKKKQ